MVAGWYGGHLGCSFLLRFDSPCHGSPGPTYAFPFAINAPSILLPSLPTRRALIPPEHNNHQLMQLHCVLGKEFEKDVPCRM